ncbi:MAG: helix-turn-helix transcriptional regulator [Deferribacteres bacterium]|nr:helix-turn-helix transcriptional regulator [Deferribacteres bacterium]
MDMKAQDFAVLIKDIRRQLAFSQEDLARQIGVSYATVNRWENCQSRPSKLARVQFDSFCVKMVRQGKLRLPGGDK